MFLSLRYSTMVKFILNLFLQHKNTLPLSPLKETQLSVNCYVSVVIFTKMLKPLQFLIFIALGGTSQSRPKNVPLWRQQTDVTETLFLSIFSKMLFYIIMFSILAIGKHINIRGRSRATATSKMELFVIIVND